ncbi:MAG: hypothetical protein ABIK98_14975 [Pseudomonadota bacterium]|uniref:HPr kinase/phosphorylase C-terminal domain-containing protein n=1 Tax=Candidatus Desulfatibia profunda TaxID=2841695 RepID=A0A8J6NXN1_9BACT|nr:hypothetical protein [Candidatus Desulfatibia profunda]MBU0699052.1 hypothetical protein [Pseudomonadota bacterium]
MELTVDLAGTKIDIIFAGQSNNAIALCNHYFRNFIHPDRGKSAAVKISVLETTNSRLPVKETNGEPIFEQLLSTPDVVQWLRKVPQYKKDFLIDETTICSFCMDGLLLFSPETATGHIYLLKQGPRMFRPLYRLLWIYFAQVLGEEESCFVHAAALVRRENGYLFMGDSGAGKSTLAGACRQDTVLSDDSPVFRKRNGKYHVFPSPYHQMDRLKILNREVPDIYAEVKGLYFLIKDDDVSIHKISKKKAVSMIINRYILFFPYLSPRAKRLLFDLFLEVCHNLHTHYLHYLPGRDVWSVIADG